MNSPNRGNVGIVIVSHSPKIAEGAADMVRQMVGEEVQVAWTGGNPAGVSPGAHQYCDAPVGVPFNCVRNQLGDRI